MNQLAFDLAPSRRIDITLQRLDELLQAATDEERNQIASAPWWGVLVIVSHLRSMELAEEAAGSKATNQLADAYDRLIRPGEHAVEAILRTYRAVYDRADSAMPEARPL